MFVWSIRFVFIYRVRYFIFKIQWYFDNLTIKDFSEIFTSSKHLMTIAVCSSKFSHSFPSLSRFSHSLSHVFLQQPTHHVPSLNDTPSFSHESWSAKNTLPSPYNSHNCYHNLENPPHLKHNRKRGSKKKKIQNPSSLSISLLANKLFPTLHLSNSRKHYLRH